MTERVSNLSGKLKEESGDKVTATELDKMAYVQGKEALDTTDHQGASVKVHSLKNRKRPVEDPKRETRFQWYQRYVYYQKGKSKTVDCVAQRSPRWEDGGLQTANPDNFSST